MSPSAEARTMRSEIEANPLTVIPAGNGGPFGGRLHDVVVVGPREVDCVADVDAQRRREPAARGLSPKRTSKDKKQD